MKYVHLINELFDASDYFLNSDVKSSLFVLIGDGYLQWS